MGKVKKSSFNESNNLKKKKSVKKSKKSKAIRRKKITKDYSSDSIKKAFTAVKEGQSLREAADQFGVPKSTLHWRLTHNSVNNIKKGPKTVLTQEEEEDIVKWILESHERGFTVTKSRLLDCVKKFIVDSKRDNPFRDSRPGKHWYEAFIRRNPILSQRVAQNLTTTRASVTEEELRGWFLYVRQCLEKRNLLDIDSNRVFNLDESAFKLVPQEDKVIAKKGAKTVYRIVGCSEKTTVTVLLTASAAGILAPPMILFELKTAPKRSTLEWIPKGWGVGNSDGGWMTGETFYSYIKNIFYKWLVDNEYQFPVILYVDNHSSHVNLQLLNFCKEKGIELFALYPNSTHIIQPLDVAFFHPLKVAYKKAVVQYKLEKEIIDLKKCMVAPVLQMAIDSMDLKESIINGFRTSGLYPLDPNSVNYNVLKKEKKKKFVNAADVAVSNKQEENSVDKNSMLLNYFEMNMSADILEAFRRDESTGVWTGESNQQALFEMWLKMRTLHDKTFNGAEEHEVPTSNDDTQNSLISNESTSMENASENTLSGTNILNLDNTDFIESHSTKMPDESQFEVTCDSGILGDLTEDSSTEIEFFDEYGNKRTAAIIQVIPTSESYVNSDDTISKPETTFLTHDASRADENIFSLEKIDQINLDHKDDSAQTVDTSKAIVLDLSLDKPSNEYDAAKSDCRRVLQEIPLNQSEPKDQFFNQCTENIRSTDVFKDVFKVDKFDTKSKKKSKAFEGTSAYHIDDMIENLQKKENEKIQKEQEILLHKQKREKSKLIRAKELEISKSFKKAKDNLLKQKKELNAEINEQKLMIKAATSKETITALKEKLSNLTTQLEELDNSINFQEMEALAYKLKIKQEIL